MDPISIAGLGASVLGIVDVITKSIKVLRELQVQWKAADWTAKSLIGQLITLRTALNQIQAWMSSSLASEPQHYQLVADLSESLECCRALVTFMHEQLSRLSWTDAHELTLASKARAIFHDGEAKECAVHLNHQASALTLLLTTLNCQSLSQQNYLLNTHENRKLLDQLKDDSSSLLGMRSKSAFRRSRIASTCTESSALMSLTFDFDSEVLDSNAYRRLTRCILRQPISKDKILDQSATNFSTQDRFLKFERYLKGKRPFPAAESSNKLYLRELSLRLQVTVPILGSEDSGLSTIMELLKSLPIERRPYEKMVEATTFIRSNLISSMQNLLRVMECVGIKTSSPDSLKSAAIILSLSALTSNSTFGWSKDIADSLTILWQQMELWRCQKYATEGWDSYLLYSASRIANPDYMPTDEDINRILLKPIESYGASVICEDKTINFIASNGRSSDLKQKLTLRMPIPVIVFVIDISCDLEYYQECSKILRESYTFSHLVSEANIDFIKSILTYYSYMKTYMPNEVVILINGSRVFVQPKDEQQEHYYEDNCLESILLLIRQMTQIGSQEMHMHFTKSLEGDRNSQVACDFVVDSVRDALGRWN